LVASASAESAKDLLDEACVQKGLCLHLGCGQAGGGRPGAEALLPAAPVHHGICLVSGRAIVCLEDGSVVCLGL
jgi:hypothetical protein